MFQHILKNNMWVHMARTHAQDPGVHQGLTDLRKKSLA